jgi:fumarate hydratase class II
MGQMDVPADALYGAQTARAAGNFPISGWRMDRRFIAALGRIKQAAADVHKHAGRLDEAVADAIMAAAAEVADGELDDQFVVDVFQTGSGTSSNMNANEVIANRAMQMLGEKGGASAVHPNDHVNMAQSSNDVIPSAIHVAAAMAVRTELVPALTKLRDALAAKADEFDSVLKIGRTHLMDAVPMRLGQAFGGYAAQIDDALTALGPIVDGLCELPIGGTAIGTGLNAPADFGKEVCRYLSAATSLPFVPASNHFAAQGAKDAIVRASGSLKATAMAMGKIASDIRLLGSGPRCGLGELSLPALQPGSSIMPGKVNPVICESVIQVACQVIGCDAAITAGATGGVGSILELNVAMPMMAHNLLTAVALLASAATVFTDKCITGLQANTDRCEELVEQSLAMVTALAPTLGYDTAAEIAKAAHESGKTIREIVVDRGDVDEATLNNLLDARKQTGG